MSHNQGHFSVDALCYNTKFESQLLNGLDDYIYKYHEPITTIYQITPEQFFTDFFLPEKPVLMKGACKVWPIYKNFSLEYLKSKTKNKTVSLDVYTRESTIAPLHFFLDQLENKTSKRYLQELNLPHVDAGLVEDIDDLIFCAKPNQFFELMGFHFRSLWIGLNRVKTILHRDYGSTSTLNAHLRGSKQWLFISPEAKYSEKDLTASGCQEFLSDNFSHVQHALAEAGDILFIPTHYYHRVLGSSGLNVNVTNQLLHQKHLYQFVRESMTTMLTLLFESENLSPNERDFIKSRLQVARKHML